VRAVAVTGKQLATPVAQFFSGNWAALTGWLHSPKQNSLQPPGKEIPLYKTPLLLVLKNGQGQYFKFPALLSWPDWRWPI